MYRNKFGYVSLTAIRYALPVLVQRVTTFNPETRDPVAMRRQLQYHKWIEYLYKELENRLKEPLSEIIIQKSDLMIQKALPSSSSSSMQSTSTFTSTQTPAVVTVVGSVANDKEQEFNWMYKLYEYITIYYNHQNRGREVLQVLQRMTEHGYAPTFYLNHKLLGTALLSEDVSMVKILAQWFLDYTIDNDPNPLASSPSTSTSDNNNNDNNKSNATTTATTTKRGHIKQKSLEFLNLRRILQLALYYRDSHLAWSGLQLFFKYNKPPGAIDYANCARVYMQTEDVLGALEIFFAAESNGVDLLFDVVPNKNNEKVYVNNTDDNGKTVSNTNTTTTDNCSATDATASTNTASSTSATNTTSTSVESNQPAETASVSTSSTTTVPVSPMKRPSSLGYQLQFDLIEGFGYVSMNYMYSLNIYYNKW